MQSAQCDPKELACQKRSGCYLHASTYDLCMYILYLHWKCMIIYIDIIHKLHRYISIYSIYHNGKLYTSWTRMISWLWYTRTFCQRQYILPLKRAHSHKCTSLDLPGVWYKGHISRGRVLRDWTDPVDSDEFTFLFHAKQMIDKR